MRPRGASTRSTCTVTASPSWIALPDWAENMRQVFRGGTISQFVLHGNVFDFVPLRNGSGSTSFVPLSRFLTDVLFEPFDVVLFYNRGKGIRTGRGDKEFHEFLVGFDQSGETIQTRITLKASID